MTLSSDEFDGDIRGLLYEVRDRIEDNVRPDARSDDLLAAVESAIHWADDYRVELMDDEDEQEELFMKQHEADDIGDAKLEKQRDDRG